MDNIETTIAVAEGQFDSKESVPVQIKKTRTVEDVSYVTIESLNRDIEDLNTQISALESDRNEKQELLKTVSVEADKGTVIK